MHAPASSAPASSAPTAEHGDVAVSAGRSRARPAPRQRTTKNAEVERDEQPDHESPTTDRDEPDPGRVLLLALHAVFARPAASLRALSRL